jgi:methyl-accepting chemotaxis protein
MLKNTTIKTKILSVILLLALVACLGIAEVSRQFWKTDEAYSRYISNEATASLQTSRASARTMVAVLQIARAQQLAPGSVELSNTKTMLDSYLEIATDQMNEAAALMPSTKPAADEIIARISELRELGHKAFDAFGRGDAATGSKLVTEAYVFLDNVTPMFVKNNDAMAKSLIEGSATLTDRTINTIIFSVGGVAIGIAGGIALSIYLSGAGITAPLAKLQNRMLSLAGGNTDEDVSGTDRKDEVGKMAAAVEVFRAGAIERMRLEQQAESERTTNENDRVAREQVKAQEAANLQNAVRLLGQALGSLASGDLTHSIEERFTPELESLRQDFNAAVAKLNEALHAVEMNASVIAAGSNQIRSSADDLSKRTEQQAASVEETAAALEQITTTVRDASMRLTETSQLVGRAREGAERSGEVVRNAIQAMHRIERSSHEISSIIGVIDDIAFQTNLLALNAGVEAARAGDAGKGFAVVAQEVRELAQRSAQAAKEIKALITTSTAEVESGVTFVGNTGKALDVIVSEVQEINRHVHAISEASREQSTGLQEINTAVNAMDQGTQQNAAMVEETTAASHSLAGEAATLSQLMAQFKLQKLAGKTPVAVVAAEANTDSRPVASPARQLGIKVARAFRGNAALKQEWTDF